MTTKLAKDILKDAFESFEQIKKQIYALVERQKETDRAISELMHELETSKFDACQGYWFADRLRVLRQERRVIKNELHILNNAKKMMPIQMVQDFDKYCKTKTSIIDHAERNGSYNGEWYENFKVNPVDVVS